MLQTNIYNINKPNPFNIDKTNIMLKRIVNPLLLLSCALISCNSQPSAQGNSSLSTPLVIHRFDKLLYNYLEEGKAEYKDQLRNEYSGMLDVMTKGVLKGNASDSLDFFDAAPRYFGEPTLRGLYKDALVKYDSIADIEAGLNKGFSYLHEQFPNMQIPAVYMHVSGLNQNVLVADSLLSLSVDKYMGSDYALYKDFFYEPQRQKMERANIVPDYLSGWLLSEFPYTGSEQVLLDKMLYEGKIKYLLAQALPETTPSLLMGYNEGNIQWCKTNEKKIWKTIIERKHLFTPNKQTTARYFEDTSNSSFLANEAPANLGTWMGWQIINEYMKKSGNSPIQLMQMTNAQEILRIAEYK